MKVIIFLMALVFAVLVMPAHGYILDVEPEPAYSYGNFLKPLEVETMESHEVYQIIVIIAMLLVNLMLVALMYLNAKKHNPGATFDVQYLIYAMFGVFLGLGLFLPSMTYEGTYIEIFVQAAVYAIAGEGLVVKGAKAGKTAIKNLS